MGSANLFSLLTFQGFGWSRDHFLCRVSYDTTLWISDENSGDKSQVFLVVVTHRVKEFSDSHVALPIVRMLGMFKNLRGDATKIAQSN